MPKPIKIGFLSSYSSICPDLNQELVEGFVTAFGKPHRDQQLFQFIPEYVHQGGRSNVSNAVQKLIHFDGVDIISGLISYFVVPEIRSLVENRNKTAFMFDLGECIPHDPIISDHFFFNSFQLWQSEYALGYWAFKEFGDKGIVIMPLYEAGYQMHSAFRQGAIAAGSTLIDYHVFPFDPNKKSIKEDVEGILSKLEKERPSFIHALFSGTEAVEFITGYARSSLKKEVPLLVTGHMASEGILDQVMEMEDPVYASSTWDYRDDLSKNVEFVSKYTHNTGKKATVFALLGYELGLVFRELLPHMQRGDWDFVRKQLKEQTISGPRGDVSFHPDSGYLIPDIAIEKIKATKGKLSKLVVSQGKGLHYNEEIFQRINNERVSGWQNPYLCV